MITQLKPVLAHAMSCYSNRALHTSVQLGFVAVQPAPTPSSSAAAMSHDRQDGAKLSQELPSFHDWGQTGTPHLPASKATGSPFAAPGFAAANDAAASHEAGDASARKPVTLQSTAQHAAQLSSQLPAQLPLSLPSSLDARQEAEGQMKQIADQQESSAAAARQHALGSDATDDDPAGTKQQRS